MRQDFICPLICNSIFYTIAIPFISFSAQLQGPIETPYQTLCLLDKCPMKHVGPLPHTPIETPYQTLFAFDWLREFKICLKKSRSQTTRVCVPTGLFRRACNVQIFPLYVCYADITSPICTYNQTRYRRQTLFVPVNNHVTHIAFCMMT